MTHRTSKYQFERVLEAIEAVASEINSYYIIEEENNMYKGLLKQYASYLPVNENTPDVSLMEGNTPLIPLLNISKQLGIQLYGKYEGANPTGSFKDVVWSWQLLRRKKKVQRQSFVHQQVIHQHQLQHMRHVLG